MDYGFSRFFDPEPVTIFGQSDIYEHCNEAMHSVYFNGYYFYIKDDDLRSKRVFLLLNHFYQLKATVASANTGTILSLPVG